jgi:hypothetical protein
MFKLIFERYASALARLVRAIQMLGDHTLPVNLPDPLNEAITG